MPRPARRPLARLRLPPRRRAARSRRATSRSRTRAPSTWRRGHGEGIQLAYHWLDERGNAIVWDGLRTPLPHPVAPGERASRRARRARRRCRPAATGSRSTSSTSGRRGSPSSATSRSSSSTTCGRGSSGALAARGGDADGARRAGGAARRRGGGRGDRGPRAGRAPAPDWSRRVLDAHQEGYAVVAGAIEVETRPLRRRPRELDPWRPGGGRVPGFAHPLLCPSLVRGVEGEWVEAVAGLPALRPPPGSRRSTTAASSCASRPDARLPDQAVLRLARPLVPLERDAGRRRRALDEPQRGRDRAVAEEALPGAEDDREDDQLSSSTRSCRSSVWMRSPLPGTLISPSTSSFSFATASRRRRPAGSCSPVDRLQRPRRDVLRDAVQLRRHRIVVRLVRPPADEDLVRLPPEQQRVAEPIARP